MSGSDDQFQDFAKRWNGAMESTTTGAAHVEYGTMEPIPQKPQMRMARFVKGFSPGFRLQTPQERDLADACRVSWSAASKIQEEVAKNEGICQCVKPRVKRHTATCLICEKVVEDKRLNFSPKFGIRVEDDPLRHLYDRGCR
jgi:hypothetical protein